jgi:hypothetical protein
MKRATLNIIELIFLNYSILIKKKESKYKIKLQ